MYACVCVCAIQSKTKISRNKIKILTDVLGIELDHHLDRYALSCPRIPAKVIMPEKKDNKSVFIAQKGTQTVFAKTFEEHSSLWYWVEFSSRNITPIWIALDYSFRILFQFLHILVKPHMFRKKYLFFLLFW